MDTMDKEQSKMPSKKVLSLLIIVSALVFSILIVFGKEKSSVAIESLGNIVVGEKITIPKKTDWQNELEQVGDNAQIPLAQSAEESSATKTYTDKVSESLLSNYLVLKQNGSINTATAQDLVNQTQEFIEGDTYKTFKRSQLSLLPDGGTSQIAEYGEALGTLIKSNKGNGFVNELKIFQEAIAGGQREKLAELETVAKTYEKISYNLLQIGVPIKFADAHLDMANGLRGVSIGLMNVRNVMSDPVLGLEGMKKYQDNATVFLNAMRATAEYIKVSGITYKQGTGGYYLLYGI